MNNLGAEIRKFHRLGKSQLFDDTRLRDAIRISAHDSVDVGPDAKFCGVTKHPHRETLHDSDRFMQRRLFYLKLLPGFVERENWWGVGESNPGPVG